MYGQSNYGTPYYGANQYYGGYSSPMYQPNTQPAIQQNTNTNKLYATGIEDVRARQLPPNSDYIFLDNDKPIIYRKTTDSTGRMDIQVFEIRAFQPEQAKAEQPFDPSQFALKTEIEALKTELSQMKESMRTTYYRQPSKNKEG